MTDQSLQRKQRLAVALRENLKRRKAQQRVRASGSVPSETLSGERLANEPFAGDNPAPANPQSHGQPHDAQHLPSPSTPDGH